MTAPCLPGIFSEPPRIADTSLVAWERIRPTLTKREQEVFLGLCDHAGPDGLTGGELAEAMGIPVTHTRPRLTGLNEKGWIWKQPARMSRAKDEGISHPYVCAVPRAAVERARDINSSEAR